MCLDGIATVVDSVMVAAVSVDAVDDDDSFETLHPTLNSLSRRCSCVRRQGVMTIDYFHRCDTHHAHDSYVGELQYLIATVPLNTQSKIEFEVVTFYYI